MYILKDLHFYIQFRKLKSPCTEPCVYRVPSPHSRDRISTDFLQTRILQTLGLFLLHIQSWHPHIITLLLKWEYKGRKT